MNVQVVYCNHQTTRLDVREKLAFATSDQLERAYQELHNSFPDSELVIISTCNRVEVYTSQEDSEETPTRQQFDAAAHADAIVFASSGSASAWGRLELPVAPVVAAIGPRTAAALRADGVAVDVIPDTHDVPDLVAALISFRRITLD